MARPLRITYPGAFYHITSRGNEQKSVFISKRDREKFLEYLESASERYNAIIHVYCLMDNHYHLLLETPSGNLPQIMRHINGAYTTYFNVKHDRAGHLFQGRYKAILVEKDEYAKELSRYIHLNPVRAGIVELPEEYEWSSYLSYIGKNKKLKWLYTDFILGYFSKTKSSSEKQYQIFVISLINSEYDSPLDNVVASTILGQSDFVNDIKEKHLSDKKIDKEIPALKELADNISIDSINKEVDSIFSDQTRLSRNIKIYLIKEFTGKLLKDIGEEFGIGESGVSQSCRRFSQQIERNKEIKKKVERITKILKLSRVKT
jgi:putative transposase